VIFTNRNTADTAEPAHATREQRETDEQEQLLLRLSGGLVERIGLNRNRAGVRFQYGCA